MQGRVNMVALDMHIDLDSSVYLDIYHVEKTRDGFQLSATLGDGWYEGEVVILSGGSVEVTFVDALLAEARLRSFFARVEPAELRHAIAEAVGSMTFCIESFPALDGRPADRIVALRSAGRTLGLPARSYSEQLDLPLRVGSGESSWQQVA